MVRSLILIFFFCLFLQTSVFGYQMPWVVEELFSDSLVSTNSINKNQDLVFSPNQESAFRAWLARIIWEQFRNGPNQRWSHRDCAGLVRFALRETLKIHDKKWRQQNSIGENFLPPELILENDKVIKLNVHGVLNKKNTFLRAINLINENTKFISKDINQGKLGDLLYFDQGENQHLMVLMNNYIAYHNGTPTKKDSGLRIQQIKNLMTFKDTRWRPIKENPNFMGVYRFSFLL